MTDERVRMSEMDGLMLESEAREREGAGAGARGRLREGRSAGRESSVDGLD